MHRIWKKDFTVFAKYIRDLDRCPSEELLTSRSFGKRLPLSIDRIDTEGNYEPGNIKWSTKIEQANNKSSNIIVDYQGNKFTLPQAVRKYGKAPYKKVYKRFIQLGWSLERALVTP
jgi:hypothetical protein